MFDNSYNIANFLIIIIFVTVICDPWVLRDYCQKLQLTGDANDSIFSDPYFLIEVFTLFLNIMLLHM